MDQSGLQSLIDRIAELRERQQQLVDENEELLRQMEELVVQQEQRKAGLLGDERLLRGPKKSGPVASSTTLVHR